MAPFVKLASKYFSPENATASINPVSFLKHVTRKHSHLRIGRQEDAHEFLRCVIDELHESEALGDKELSLAQHVWGFYLESCVRCFRCKNRSITRDAAMDLSLDICGRNVASLEDALDAFFTEDKLDRDNKVDCDRCKKKRRSGKQFFMGSAPHVLACHLKRFDYTGRKVGKFIEYGDKLDVGPYIVRDTPNTADVLDDDDGAPFVPYRLFGVVVHSGSSQFGHYYAYVRPDPKSRRWWELNDRSCRRVDRTTALGQSAYILFYVRGGEGEEMAMHRVRRRLSMANMARTVSTGDDDDDDEEDDEGEEGERHTAAGGEQGMSARSSRRAESKRAPGRGGAGHAAPASSWIGSMFGWSRSPSRAVRAGTDVGVEDLEAAAPRAGDAAHAEEVEVENEEEEEEEEGAMARRSDSAAPVPVGHGRSVLPTSMEIGNGQFSGAAEAGVVRHNALFDAGRLSPHRHHPEDADAALADAFAEANPQHGHSRDRVQVAGGNGGPASVGPVGRRRGTTGSRIVRGSVGGGGGSDRWRGTRRDGCCAGWACCCPQKRRAPPPRGTAAHSRQRVRVKRSHRGCGCENPLSCIPLEARRFLLALLILAVVGLIVYVGFAATVAKDWRPAFASDW